MNDLEFLLNQRENLIEKTNYNEFGQMREGVHDSKRLKSEKSASLHNFIEMIDKVVTLTMKDMNVKFIPDEGKIVYLSNDKPLDHIFITYKLVDRVPKLEKKPRVRETIVENTKEGARIGEVWGQTFKCHLQFNIFASVYTEAEQVMEKFEEVLIAYAGFFKRNGVGEIIFDKQFTDDHYETMRQTLSIRNLRYYVEIEKLTVIMKESIQEIETY